MQTKGSEGRFVSVPVEVRLFEGIDTSDPSACWIWQKYRLNGYGQISDNGRNRLAHRVSYELAHGPIQDGLDVCHRCDNPACINPAHLFAGTAKDNMADMMAKGRKTILGGEEHPMAKLSVDEVFLIRSASGTHRQIAARRGVSKSTVTRIKSGQSWRYL